MTDVPETHPTANADASGPSAEQAGGAPPPKQFGRARSPHQAAAALRDSLRTLQAMMDAIAELFECAQRNEDCSDEDSGRAQQRDAVGTHCRLCGRRSASRSGTGKCECAATIGATSCTRNGRSWWSDLCPGCKIRRTAAGNSHWGALEAGPLCTVGAGAHSTAPSGNRPPAPGPHSRQQVRCGAGLSAPVRPGAGDGLNGGVSQTNGER